MNILFDLVNEYEIVSLFGIPISIRKDRLLKYLYVDSDGTIMTCDTKPKRILVDQTEEYSLYDYHHSSSSGHVTSHSFCVGILDNFAMGRRLMNQKVVFQGINQCLFELKDLPRFKEVSLDE